MDTPSISIRDTSPNQYVKAYFWEAVDRSRPQGLAVLSSAM